MSELLNCPLCGSRGDFIFKQKFSVCKKCMVVYNAEWKSDIYSEDYFNKDYKKQYGRTYLEDRDNIITVCRRRINRMKIRKDYNSAIDIGCAYGFFLEALRDYGIQKLCGVEVSVKAAEYCMKNGFKVESNSFLDYKSEEKFSIVTAWYFLEHCSDSADVFDKVSDLVEPGGILAFSVPSVDGPLFQRKFTQWAASHPADHRINFSRKGIKKALKFRGFNNIKIYPGGIHAERYISSRFVFFRLFVLFYRMISWLTGYSDTIEVYAVKGVF